MANQYSNPIPPHIHNRIGERRGRLTIVGFSRMVDRRARWYCQCRCGAIQEAHPSTLYKSPEGPCHCRHTLPDGRAAKVCSACQVIKPLNDYYAHADAPDGRQSWCKECARAVDGQRNKQKVATKNHNYHAANKDAILRRHREWLANNVDKVADRKKKYRAENKEKVQKYERERLQANKEKMRAKNQRWRNSNPDKVRATKARREAIKKAAPGRFTADDIAVLFTEQGGMCAYHLVNPRCHKELRDKYEVDHITPLIRGGTNWPDNIQLLCPHCNSSKGAKLHEEFLAYLATL